MRQNEVQMHVTERTIFANRVLIWPRAIMVQKNQGANGADTLVCTTRKQAIVSHESESSSSLLLKSMATCIKRIENVCSRLGLLTPTADLCSHVDV
jgi:hypothetical protein